MLGSIARIASDIDDFLPPWDCPLRVFYLPLGLGLDLGLDSDSDLGLGFWMGGLKRGSNGVYRIGIVSESIRILGKTDLTSDEGSVWDLLSKFFLSQSSRRPRPSLCGKVCGFKVRRTRPLVAISFKVETSTSPGNFLEANSSSFFVKAEALVLGSELNNNETGPSISW